MSATLTTGIHGSIDRYLGTRAESLLSFSNPKIPLELPQGAGRPEVAVCYAHPRTPGRDLLPLGAHSNSLTLAVV